MVRPPRFSVICFRPFRPLPPKKNVQLCWNILFLRRMSSGRPLRRCANRVGRGVLGSCFGLWRTGWPGWLSSLLMTDIPVRMAMGVGRLGLVVGSPGPARPASGGLTQPRPKTNGLHAAARQFSTRQSNFVVFPKGRRCGVGLLLQQPLLKPRVNLQAEQDLGAAYQVLPRSKV